MHESDPVDGETCSALPAGLTPGALRAAVRDRYAAVAIQPEGQRTFRVGRGFAEALGYPADLLDSVPASAVDAFTGVATPVLRAEIQPGDSVLDLGCGAGLDLALAARAAGLTGRTLGVDVALPMARRAHETIATLALQSTWVVVAQGESLPLGDNCIDVVVANGILNLAPAKAAILSEVARVLRPGGRFMLAETTLRQVIPADTVRTLDDWFR